MNERIQILLTNDDGIQSPGLWAAASALSKLGYVTIAAPRDQVSSTGRSMPRTSDGRIERTVLRIDGQDWPVFASRRLARPDGSSCGFEIMPAPPDLVVSGINYGENLGTSITISGTVGAAMEGAGMGIPPMASFSAAAGNDFLRTPTWISRRRVLYPPVCENAAGKPHSPAMSTCLVDVPTRPHPRDARRCTHLARHRYYQPGRWSSAGTGMSRCYIDGHPRWYRSENHPGFRTFTRWLFDDLGLGDAAQPGFTSRVDLVDLEETCAERLAANNRLRRVR